MKKTAYIVIITLLLLAAAQVAVAQGIVVSANPIIHAQYSKWTDKHHFETLPDFSLMKAHRGEVELALLCHALRLGGFTGTISVLEVPNYSRALLDARLGNVTMPAETTWDTEADPAFFYSSAPVIEDGTNEFGVYALKSNTAIMRVRTLGELQRFTCVSSDNWIKDWQALRDMGIKAYSVPMQELMFRTVAAGRVDFLLTKFSSAPNFRATMDDITLYPVPGIKLAIPGSRHFVISKKAPDAEAVFEALQSGLRQLRETGSIRKAFVDSGFINEDVKDWKRIYP